MLNGNEDTITSIYLETYFSPDEVEIFFSALKLINSLEDSILVDFVQGIVGRLSDQDFLEKYRSFAMGDPPPEWE